MSVSGLFIQTFKIASGFQYWNWLSSKLCKNILKNQSYYICTMFNSAELIVYDYLSFVYWESAFGSGWYCYIFFSFRFVFMPFVYFQMSLRNQLFYNMWLKWLQTDIDWIYSICWGEKNMQTKRNVSVQSNIFMRWIFDIMYYV